MEVIFGGGGTPQSTIRSCDMGVTLSVALDMNGSPHQIIPYLLKHEFGGTWSLIFRIGFVT